MVRRGVYRGEKRQKEIKRLKKQEEKRLKRQKKKADSNGEATTDGPETPGENSGPSGEGPAEE